MWLAILAGLKAALDFLKALPWWLYTHTAVAGVCFVAGCRGCG